MAITLDAITLPDLLIENEFGNSEIESVVAYTLGGTPLVWEQTKGGNNIDLVGGNDYGWIARSVLVSLKALAVVPRATYTLAYEGTDYTVRFRNEDQPVISATPIAGRPNQASDDWYNNVRIKLMEV